MLHHDVRGPPVPCCTGMRSLEIRMLYRECFHPLEIGYVSKLALYAQTFAALCGPTPKDEWDQLEGLHCSIWIQIRTAARAQRSCLFHVVSPSSNRIQRHQRSRAFILRLPVNHGAVAISVFPVLFPLLGQSALRRLLDKAFCRTSPH